MTVGGMGGRMRAPVSALAALCALLLGATPVAAAPRAGAPVGLPDQPFSALGPFGLDPAGGDIASGRVQDVEADPFVKGRLLALSDSAIWISDNGGESWTRSSGLDRYGQWNFSVGSLAFDPARAGVVLVASPSDRRLATARGVYRSVDGGVTWSQALDYQPRCPHSGVGSPTRVAFDGQDAYVAAGCVVGTSTDDGASWTWSAPDDGGWFGGVTTDVEGDVFACGNDGIFERQGTAWQRVVSFAASDGWGAGSPFVDGDGIDRESTCRLTASPVQADHVFFTARWQNAHADGSTDPQSAVFEAYADDQGAWHSQDLMAPWHPNGRDVNAETQLVYRDFKAVGFNFYWNSTDLWYYQPCTTGPGFECAPGKTRAEDVPDPPWTRLGYPDGGADLQRSLHADGGNILFAPTYPYCIWLVADDGGIQRPAGAQSAYNDSCLGTTKEWVYRNRGISALEPYDLAVTSFLGTRSTDVYAAAQDSGAYALLAGEPGWRNADSGNDGFVVDATYAVFPSQVGSIHVYYKGDADQHIGARGFAGLSQALFDPFSNPSDVAHGGHFWPWQGLQNPQQMSELPDGRLVIAVQPADAGATPHAPPSALTAQTALFASGDGTHWTQLRPGGGEFLAGRVSLAGAIGEGGSSVIATGTVGQPVLFVRSLGNLYRVEGSDFSSVRQLLAGQDVGWFSVSDPDHLIAFSCPSPTQCALGGVQASSDGGRTWRILATINDLVANDGFGGFYPMQGNGCADALCASVSSVAIEPHQPSVMAVGTLGSGLFESGDAGRSWERVANLIEPNIGSLRFDLSGHLYVGSYGRGIAELQPEPSQLALTRQVSLLPNRSRWVANARLATGAPLTGAPVTFTLTTSNGLVVPLGSVDTGPDGRARIDFVRPSGLTGDVTLHAVIAGEGNRELATEARFS